MSAKKIAYHTASVLLIGAMCVACSFSGMLFVPSTSPVLALPLLLALLFLLVLPAFTGYVGVSLGYLPLLLLTGGAFLATYMILGPTTAMYMGALYVPASFALTTMLRKKCATLYTAAVVCALMIIGFFLPVTLPALLAGKPMYTGVMSLFDLWASEALRLLDMYDVTEFVAALEYASLSIPIVMPALICTAGMLGGFFSLLICRRLCKKTAKLHPMPPFRQLRLPKGYLIGMGVVLLVGILGEDAGFYGFDAVAHTLSSAAFTPLFVQGLAVAGFVLSSAYSKNPGCIAPLAVMVVLLFFSGTIVTIVSLVVSFFICIGLVEQLYGVRKRLGEKR